MRSSLVRPPVAGQRGFYPLSPGVLLGQVENFLAAATATPMPLAAVIVPHAGYAYSGATAGMAFARLAARPGQRVIVIGPSHYHGFRGVALAPHTDFRTPLGDVALDTDAVARLQRADPLFQVVPQAHEEEHALEVELPFLQCLDPDIVVLPLVCGDMNLAECLRLAPALAAEWGPETVLAVSSDFTHYGPRFHYEPFPLAQAQARLPALDGGALALIVAGDAAGFADYVARTRATICGHVPLTLALAAAATRPGRPAFVQVAYTNSGELTGDFRHSVSYAALTMAAA